MKRPAPPSPAANINASVPAFVLNLGSALRASNSRIISTSPFFAARMRGVAPAPSVPSPRSCTLTRIGALRTAFGFAPCSSSAFTTPTASSLPEGFGVGRPGVSAKVFVDGGAQRCHPRDVADVRIGTEVEQRRGIVVGVDDRYVQGGHVVRIGGIEIGAGLGECL